MEQNYVTVTLCILNDTEQSGCCRATLCQCGICCRVYVRLSATSRHCIETTGQIELVLAWRLLSTYPTLCCRKLGHVCLQSKGTSL